MTWDKERHAYGGDNVLTFIGAHGERNAVTPQERLDGQLERRDSRLPRALRTDHLGRFVIEPGIYGSDQLPLADYHADESLGHSGAVTIMERSPAHFLWERTHPAEQKKEFDIGTAVHCALLEPEYFNDRMFVLPVEFKDYRKKDAQALREHAYLRDMTPLLDDQEPKGAKSATP